MSQFESYMGVSKYYVFVGYTVLSVTADILKVIKLITCDCRHCTGRDERVSTLRESQTVCQALKVTGQFLKTKD